MRNIALHHVGGTQANPYASGFASFLDVNEYHRRKWNMRSSLGHFIGYNVFYDAQRRVFTQGRAIGEETMAQRGHNFDTFSLCMSGNFKSDKLEPYMLEDVSLFLIDLIFGNKRNLVVRPGTKLDFAIHRIKPHRFYQPFTECNCLPENLFRTEVARRYYSRFPYLMPILYLLVDFYSGKGADSMGSAFDKECDGTVEIINQ